jgi:hypothetical protein
MKIIKKYLEVIVVFFWFLILLLITLSLTSCGGSESDYKVTKKDSVVQCVVDSVWSNSSPSTIQPSNVYYFKTECGNTHCVNRNLYKIGDTITYVWKKTL